MHESTRQKLLLTSALLGIRTFGLMGGIAVLPSPLPAPLYAQSRQPVSGAVRLDAPPTVVTAPASETSLGLHLGP